MSAHPFLLPAACSGLLAVVLGAFGAHALKDSLELSMYTAYQTAVQYQFYHTLALLFVILADAHLRHRVAKIACWGFFVGIVLFSGSLYLMAVTGERVLGMITPLGGIAFIVGWAALVYAAFQQPSDRR